MPFVPRDLPAPRALTAPRRGPGSVVRGVAVANCPDCITAQPGGYPGALTGTAGGAVGGGEVVGEGAALVGGTVVVV